MTTARRLVIMAVSGLIVVLASGAPALAADGTGRDYADHVRMCQREMGFSGTHNPGVMHKGFSGWNPSHMC